VDYYFVPYLLFWLLAAPGGPDRPRRLCSCWLLPVDVLSL